MAVQAPQSNPDFSGRLTVNKALTLLSAVLLTAYGVYFLTPSENHRSPDSLHYPAETAGRMFERHLEFYVGVESLPSWQQSLFQILYGPRAETEKTAIAAYREVLNHFRNQPDRASPWTVRNTQARLLVVLGETKRLVSDERELQALERTLEGAAIANLIRFAYLATPPDWTTGELSTGLRLVPSGWAADILRIRAAERLGDAGWLRWSASRLLDRAERWHRRTLYFTAGTGAVIVLGLSTLGIWWFRRLPVRPWNSSALDQPWSMGAGLAVAVQSAVLGLTILALLGSPYSPFETSLPVLWSTLFASLPMVWLIHRRLLRPRDLSFSSAFGLRLGGVPAIQLLGIVLALLAVEKGGAMLIGWGSWELGFRPHWSAGFEENWIWSTPVKRYIGSVDAVLWAPIFEEIGFRGLLYVSLRSRLGPMAAATVGSAAFGALHLSSLAGFLAVFWSGLVWAYAFERFRSLLPGIVAHGAGNLVSIIMAIAFYR